MSAASEPAMGRAAGYRPRSPPGPAPARPRARPAAPGVAGGAALSGHVLAHHAGVPAGPLLVRRPTVPGGGPRGVGEQQRSGEPARVEQLPGAVAVVQQRRGEQGVAHHRQGECADGGVDGGAAHRRAPEVQREHHADERDVEQRVGDRERGLGHAGTGPGLRRLGQRQAPRQGQQRTADQPGVEAQADPARLRHRALGQHQQAHDGGRREAEEEQVRVAGAGHGLPQHDLVPPPDGVAQGGHRRGEGEQQPGGPETDATSAGVDEAGDGRGPAAALSPKSPMILARWSEPQPNAEPTAYPAQTRARTSWRTRAGPPAADDGR